MNKRQLYLQMIRIKYVLQLSLIFIFLSGCATTNFYHQKKSLKKSSFLENVKNAAVDAATSPNTWIPLTGAVILQSGNMDKKIANWASSTNPVFGSRKRADDLSDLFVATARNAYILSSFFNSRLQFDDQWLRYKLQNFAVGLGALQFNSSLVDYLKHETERPRPDASDLKSFPSGHTSEAAINSTLTAHNISTMCFSQSYKKAFYHGLNVLTLATGWARVEANRHYPSDVLAGMAIGNFLGSFIHDAFLGNHFADNLSIETDPVRNRFQLNLQLYF